MSSFEKSRLVIGGLLLLAGLALGAGVPEAPALPRDPEVVPAATGEPGEPPAPDTMATPAPRPAAAPAKAARVDETPPPADPVASAEPLVVMEGGASWYSDALAGRRTASGEPYDPGELIAAHRALPFGTRLRVTNLDNDRSVEVRVIDRGPFVDGRVIDLSRSAAQRIGMIRAGHARVRIEILDYGS